MKIKQVPVGMMEVFCYLVYDEESREGVLIDPAGNEERLLRLLEDEGVILRYIVNTHGHADHTCGNDVLRAATGAKVVMHALDDDFFQQPEARQWAQMMGFADTGPADVRVQDGSELPVGRMTLKFLHTPGHTPGACCILIDGHLFTGDTLFVGAVGRTDLPGGSFEVLLESLKTKIMTLPKDTVVWPGHDYGEQPHSTVDYELTHNPYLTDFLDD
jgi:glyoxylase-like metal-dependent hydrolase (beta-lactamase superfamily II)